MQQAVAEAIADTGKAKIPVPPRPNTVDDTGIERTMLMNLLSKAMYVLGLQTASALAEHLKVSSSVVTTLLEEMRDQSLLESRGLAGADITSQIRYGLTQKGVSWALDATEQSAYVGPVPVTLDAFCRQVATQRISVERIGPKELQHQLRNLILPEDLIHRLGPAANSAKSILLYGAPGNGKTCIAEGIGAAFSQTIYLPYCIEVGGQIINFYDETVHQRVDDPEAERESTRLIPRGRGTSDARWVPCKRPVVMTGGELTLDQLDLQYVVTSKFYEAPLHLKALGGVFIVDDFGRQRDTPQSILNRWIVPLEKGIDYLTLHTGKKFPIPFDELVVFSTNIPPGKLTDEATLRRLYYKIKIPKPNREDFVAIFQRVCEMKGIEYRRDMVDFLFKNRYDKLNMEPSGFHPIFFIEQVISICEYYDAPIDPNDKTLGQAWGQLLRRLRRRILGPISGRRPENGRRAPARDTWPTARQSPACRPAMPDS